jgi:hypothetical protein
MYGGTATVIELEVAFKTGMFNSNPLSSKKLTSGVAAVSNPAPVIVSRVMGAAEFVDNDDIDRVGGAEVSLTLSIVTALPLTIILP